MPGERHDIPSLNELVIASKYIHWIKNGAVVKNPDIGYVEIKDANHEINPALLWLASQLIHHHFLRFVEPGSFIGIPNKGKELATTLSLFYLLKQEREVRQLVTDRTPNGQPDGKQIEGYYHPRSNKTHIDHVPSFTKGIEFNHLISGQVNGTTCAADDFIARGPSARAYLSGLREAGANPVLVALAAKDFPHLSQTGYRDLIEEGEPVYAAAVITQINNDGSITVMSDANFRAVHGLPSAHEILLSRTLRE